MYPGLIDSAHKADEVSPGGQGQAHSHFPRIRNRYAGLCSALNRQTITSSRWRCTPSPGPTSRRCEHIPGKGGHPGCTGEWRPGSGGKGALTQDGKDGFSGLEQPPRQGPSTLQVKLGQQSQFRDPTQDLKIRLRTQKYQIVWLQEKLRFAFNPE